MKKPDTRGLDRELENKKPVRQTLSMRLEIPVYRELKLLAQSRGTTMNSVMVALIKSVTPAGRRS